MKPRSFAMVLFLCAACGGKGVTDSTSPPIKPDTTPTQTVQRTSLTVRVSIDPADATLASTAGVGIGGLTVRLTRAGSTDAPRTATTDASGTVKFDALLDGSYTASVERALTSTELTRLAPADRDASVFAGGVTTAVSPPAAQSTSMSIVGARRGSLVISEVFGYYGNPIPYNWGSYIEVYNNSDTTAYLDGMYIAMASWGTLQTGVLANCDVAEYQPYRADTARVWLANGIRFPGNGSQFPVPPGASRVYAADAINHRVASGSQNFADLSNAQFEQVGTDSDTDNPLAANVIPVFNTKNGTGGRGLRIQQGAWVLLKATADSRLQKITLPPYNVQDGAGVPFTPSDLWGASIDDVVDVFSLDFSPDFKAYIASTTYRYTVCLPWQPAALERAPAELYDSTYRPGAIRRRSLGRTADGREILMRTRTSARDLEVTTNLLQRSLNK